MEIKIDYKALLRAIKKSPELVAQETKNFLYRAEKRLESKTGSTPWRVGSSGGGSPIAKVSGGNLLRAHKAERKPFSLKWFVDERIAPYAKYVHGIVGFPRKGKYQLRPWLRWVEKEAEQDINKDSVNLVDRITRGLGK